VGEKPEEDNKYIRSVYIYLKSPGVVDFLVINVTLLLRIFVDIPHLAFGLKSSTKTSLTNIQVREVARYQLANNLY